MFLTIKLFVADMRAVLKKEPNPYLVVLGPRAQKTRAVVRIVMQVVISVAVIGLSWYVIVDPTQSEAIKKLAFSGLGTIVGYWLR